VKQADFLRLLAAQLQYQNPLEPAKDTEFLGQLAQFDSLQKMEELTRTMSSLLTVAQLSSTSALLGKQVTATSRGETVSGVVQRITLANGEVLLQVGNRQLKLGEVTELVGEQR
jgi:flagellar basal-body rod modification protein FlgD